MCASQSPSSLSIQLKIIRAKNVKTELQGKFFIRFYLPSGNNQRIQLTTQETSSRDELFWDESFSLECNGRGDSIENLKEQSVEFELRRRSTTHLVGKFSASQLVGRGEIPWRNFFQSPEMEIQAWVPLTLAVRSGCVTPEGAEPPTLLVAMKVMLVSPSAETERKKRFRVKERDECDCSSCVDSELLAVAAALDGF